MVLYENTLIQFKKDILRKKLVGFLCAEYEAASKNTVSGEIRYAWRYTFQLIYSMLNLMGPDANPESGVRIDLEESEHARHIKLIFASGSSDEFHYSLLGLFAGSTVRLSKAEDIVVFQEGSLQWSAVHPSMFMSSFARRLLRGSPEDGKASVSFEGASWLFDCFFSCDSDIITNYKRQLTDEFPVFYANDTDYRCRFPKYWNLRHMYPQPLMHVRLTICKFSCVGMTFDAFVPGFDGSSVIGNVRYSKG